MYHVYELDMCLGTYHADSADDAIAQHKRKFSIIGDGPFFAVKVS